jgi:enoyl-CoA hydratase/carnithine racemase
MYDYKSLRVAVSDGVAQVTIDNPPVNLLDTTLIGDLGHFIGTVRDDRSVRVVVFQSANPDFFLAHVDFRYMEHPDQFAALAELVPGDGTLNPMQSLHLALRSLPQLTIVKLRGRLRGGGNEFAMAADLRFAAAGQTWLSQVESRIGIIPGGGGTQLLPRLVGRARALEVIDGALVQDDLAAALAREGQALGAVYPAPEALVAKVARAVQAGAQTPDGELDLENAIARA